LKIGAVCDGARIDNGDICALFEGDDSIPLLLNGIDKSLRLELVHFTTECGDSNGGHRASGLSQPHN
jgi:hypothetical protein